MGLYIKLGLLAIGLTLAAARNPCANWKGRALPDISDCRKYIYCQDHVPYEFECPTTYHFDLHLRKCRPMHLAVCATGMFRRRSIPTAPPKTTCARLPTTTTAKPVPTVSTTTPSGQPSTNNTNDSVITNDACAYITNNSNHINYCTYNTNINYCIRTYNTNINDACAHITNNFNHINYIICAYNTNNFNYKCTHSINESIIINLICAYFTNSFYIISHI
ncbi:chitin binding peritrophin-A domain-containing protein [Phthorimaea operculella]|nr:chitin binding peritrophin-A domain-containing protein [Phthorimaea operculella]